MADDPPVPRSKVPHTLLASLVAFLIPFIHGPASDFLYDAAQYWGGAAAIVAGEAPLVPGSLTTRGVFTSFVYLPPAMASALIGPQSAVWTVLIWNAALGAALSAVLIPRLAGLFTGKPLSPARVWVSAILVGFVLSGFTRYPLVDVWSISFALAGIYGILVGRRWWWLCLAGASLTISVNMRPSLIAPLLLCLVVILFVRAKPIAIAAPAAVLAALPQIVFNVRHWGLWSPVPHDTVPLTVVQAAPAPYTLRYDTVIGEDRLPQQWYCDPDYARLLAQDKTPHNQLDVVASAFQHLPDSVWFLARKAAANLHWSMATPYENAPGHTAGPVAVLVILVTALGAAALVLRAVRSRADRNDLISSLAMLAFLIGALGTLVFSTPETRFALPVLMIGTVGLVSTVPPLGGLARPSRGALIATGSALLLSIGLFAAGSEALGHDMPPGPLADPAECARS